MQSCLCPLLVTVHLQTFRQVLQRFPVDTTRVPRSQRPQAYVRLLPGGLHIPHWLSQHPPFTFCFPFSPVTWLLAPAQGPRWELGCLWGPR